MEVRNMDARFMENKYLNEERTMGTKEKLLKLSLALTALFTSLAYSIFNESFILNSKEALVYSLDDNSLVYERNIDKRIAPASLTKIMTALVTVDGVDNLDTKIRLGSDYSRDLENDGYAVAGLVDGEEITYRKLLEIMLIPSAADAAMALGENVYGDMDVFVKKMNDKALSLGMKDTHFDNVIGKDSDQHYTSARDLLTLFKHIDKIKVIKDIISSNSVSLEAGKVREERIDFESTILENKEALDAGIIGGKSGTTDKAGLNWVTFVRKNNKNYIVMSLGSNYRINSKLRRKPQMDDTLKMIESI